LSKWKTTIAKLKKQLERAEESVKQKACRTTRGTARKASQGGKDSRSNRFCKPRSLRGGQERHRAGRKDLTRTAKTSILKVRDAVGHRNRDEEIGQIAYYIYALFGG
jgi:hypothetical protein